MNRLTDHDKQITSWLIYGYAEGDQRAGLVLETAGEIDDVEYGDYHNAITGNIGNHWFKIKLPGWIKPVTEKIQATSWDPETIERLGRNWYHQHHQRRYGFGVWEETMAVYYGAQYFRHGDTKSSKNKYFELPWKRMRFIAQRWYDPEGRLIHTHWDKDGHWKGRYKWEQDILPKVHFQVRDLSDHSVVDVTAYTTEREWSSWFKKPFIRRVLEIEFAKEVGPSKGSWKGGLMGTSIDMLEGESPLEAFSRYCALTHSSKAGTYNLKIIPTPL